MDPICSLKQADLNGKFRREEKKVTKNEERRVVYVHARRGTRCLGEGRKKGSEGGATPASSYADTCKRLKPSVQRKKSGE